jgi:transglutaminase-like putative cysteine protease
VLEAVAYVPGETDVHQAEEARQSGRGVCQDHAHVFIGAARLLGIPARYVSGYLMMDDRIEQEAGHAWAEAHVGARLGRLRHFQRDQPGRTLCPRGHGA